MWMWVKIHLFDSNVVHQGGSVERLKGGKVGKRCGKLLAKTLKKTRSKAYVASIQEEKLKAFTPSDIVKGFQEYDQNLYDLPKTKARNFKEQIQEYLKSANMPKLEEEEVSVM